MRNSSLPELLRVFFWQQMASWSPSERPLKIARFSWQMSLFQCKISPFCTENPKALSLWNLRSCTAGLWSVSQIDLETDSSACFIAKQGQSLIRNILVSKAYFHHFPMTCVETQWQQIYSKLLLFNIWRWFQDIYRSRTMMVWKPQKSEATWHMFLWSFSSENGSRFFYLKHDFF